MDKSFRQYNFRCYFIFSTLVFFLFSMEGLKGQNGEIPDPDFEPEIGIVEHLDEFLPDDIMLTNEQSELVSLKDIIDKPTIINLVYFRCPGICSPLMDGVAEVIGRTEEMELGKEYQILTISFDARESIELGKRKKKNYLGMLDNPEPAVVGWKFFVGDSANIKKLTEAVGFKYKIVGNDFLHAASLTITSPDSKIVRYLNGTYFLPFEWKMAIIEASQGKSGPTVNKLIQFCYSFDPEGQTYVLNITRVTGILLIFFSLFFFLTLVFRNKKSKAKKQ